MYMEMNNMMYINEASERASERTNERTDERARQVTLVGEALHPEPVHPWPVAKPA